LIPRSRKYRLVFLLTATIALASAAHGQPCTGELTYEVTSNGIQLHAVARFPTPSWQRTAST
jgi:hypothetical protein